MGLKIYQQIRMTMKNQLFVSAEYGFEYYYFLDWEKISDETFYTLKELQELILPKTVTNIPGFKIHITTLIRLTANLNYAFRKVVYPKSGVSGVRKVRIYVGKDVKNAVLEKDARAEKRSKKHTLI